MKIDLVDLKSAPLKDFEKPSVLVSRYGRKGLIYGLSFSRPSLFKISETERGIEGEPEDLKLEENVFPNSLGIFSGLRQSVTGDTIFTLLHDGFIPGFLASLFKCKISGRKGEALADYLYANDGGMGAGLRHSIIQMSNGKFSIRRAKDPGMLWDVALVGDFIFGLCSGSVLREPYLNTGKREFLRKDLGFNFHFHRDDVGNFWFAGQNGRLMRMGQTDIKARPTPLKIPADLSAYCSEGSTVDGWLYLSVDQSKILKRVRVNPVSAEDEQQLVHSFATKITALCEVKKSSGVHMFVAVENPAGAEIYRAHLVPAEDPEIVGEVPKFEKVGVLSGVSALGSLVESSLTVGTEAPAVLWGGEGYVGWGQDSGSPSRLVRLSGV